MGLAWAPLIGLLASLAGCGPSDKIESYRVDKPEVLAERYFHESTAAPNTASTDRMLAAIVPHGSQFWFFKLAARDKTVWDQGPQFMEFMKSIEFPDADSPPQWKLPDGWTQRPGDEIRYATIEINAGPPPVELSVTTLPKPPVAAAADAAVLMNVNRWRGQMGLAPIARGQLAEQSKSMKIGGEMSTLISLIGQIGKGGMGAPPFASGSFREHPELPPDHPAIPDDASSDSEKPPAASPEAPAGLTFDAPAGWQPGQLNEMRKAAFVVEDGTRKVEITVVALPPFAGDLSANVNRWRGQVHLPDATSEEVIKAAKPISIGGIQGSYIELTGPVDPAPRQTILGAMAAAGDRVWFVTLRGDAKLAEREKPKFESFLKSIKFTGK